MPVIATDRNGNRQTMPDAHTAALFGMQVVGDADDIEVRSGIKRPEVTSLLGANGMLKDQYRLNAGADVTANTQAIEELRKRGLSQGPSEYANILMGKQALEEQNALGKSAQASRSASSSAFSDLARKGGLSSGARERLASMGQQSEARGTQDVLRGGMTDRLNITAGDEQQKLGILQNLPQMELGYADLGLKNRDYKTNVDKLNIAGALQEVGRQDTAKFSDYAERMKAYGAEKTAQAQANAGKK